MYENGSVVALGTFDGLHKGHQSVLLSALKFTSLTPVAVTFSEPPKRSASGEKVGMLMPMQDKLNSLYEMGFKTVKVLDYKTVRDMTAEQYLDCLFEEFNVKTVVCGFNHHFGKGGLGNAEFLTSYCHSHGAEAVICPKLTVSGHEVSSTFIRELIKGGNIGLANLLSGRAFSFKTEVCHGDERGRTIGFPTINQPLDESLVVPKLGVYATAVKVDGMLYAGVTNIGIRPTFKLQKPQSETYICDFSGNVYGKEVEIKLLKYLREERQFNSLDELQQAISEDAETAKKEFSLYI